MTTNNTDLIKDKLSIVDVVGSYVDLKKSGKTWKGKSPFTNERTPSFFVNPEKGFYYCFSTAKGGDIFTFIQEMERMDFKESLNFLAHKAGVTLSLKNQAPTDDILYKLIDDATKWFEVNLRKDKKIVDYLIDRGLNKETIIDFRIGFAKDSWDDLLLYLKRKGYKESDIEKAGLIVKKEGSGYYNRFRSRIMFPLFDSVGKVIGFSGRIVTDDKDAKTAKYVNSPEGPLYSKSKVLYGYHKAKGAISKSDHCVVVEGQFDVLLSHQSGCTQTVAVSGTALGDEQLSMISKFTKNIHMAFDSDKAGVNATKKSVIKSYQHGMSVKVIVLPQGSDPADLIVRSTAAWDSTRSSTIDYIDYRLLLYKDQFKDANFEQRHSFVINEIFDFVSLIRSSVTRDKIFQDLALFIGVSKESIIEDFNTFVPTEEIADLQTQSKKNVEREPVIKIDAISQKNDIIAMCLHMFQIDEKSQESFITKIEKDFNEIYNQTYNDALNEIDETTKAMLLFKYEEKFKNKNIQQIEKEILLNKDQELRKKLKQSSEKLLRDIRNAQQSKNMKVQEQLQRDHLEVCKRIDNLNN